MCMCVCVCVCVCVRSVCKRLSQWWLVLVLLGVNATLGDRCGQFHSFREVKCLQGFFKTLLIGM